MNKNANVNANKVLNVFLMILLIFSTDCFVTFANVNELYKNIFRILIVLACLILAVPYLKYFRYNQTSFFIWSILVGIIIINAIVRRDFGTGNLMKIILISFGVLYSCVITIENFKYYYVKLMSIISGYSLITYVMRDLFRNVEWIPRVSNGNMVMQNLVISNLDVTNAGLIRNWGPFWEPGVFQIYVLLALIIVMAEYKEKHFLKILFIVTTLSTFSTTGYIILAIILMGFLFESQKKRYSEITFKNEKILILIIFFIGAMIIMLDSQILMIVFEKFRCNSSSFVSASSRSDSIWGNLLVSIRYPLIGAGYKRMDELFWTFLKSMGTQAVSNTNGLLMNYSVYGWLFGGIWTWLMYRFVRNFNITIRMRSLVFLCMVLMLFSEPLFHSLLFNTILFYGIKPKKICKRKV